MGFQLFAHEQPGWAWCLILLYFPSYMDLKEKEEIRNHFLDRIAHFSIFRISVYSGFFHSIRIAGRHGVA